MRVQTGKGMDRSEARDRRREEKRTSWRQGSHGIDETERVRRKKRVSACVWNGYSAIPTHLPDFEKGWVKGVESCQWESGGGRVRRVIVEQWFRAVTDRW